MKTIRYYCLDYCIIYLNYLYYYHIDFALSFSMLIAFAYTLAVSYVLSLTLLFYLFLKPSLANWDPAISYRVSATLYTFIFVAHPQKSNGRRVTEQFWFLQLESLDTWSPLPSRELNRTDKSKRLSRLESPNADCSRPIVVTNEDEGGQFIVASTLFFYDRCSEMYYNVFWRQIFLFWCHITIKWNMTSLWHTA